MSFQVRKLTHQDQELYAELLRNHESTWAHEIGFNPDERSQSILTSPRMHVCAVQDVDGGPLKMSITAHLWTEMPVYTLVDFKSVESFQPPSFKRAFGPMIYNLVVAMEAEERHEFWYLIEDKDLYASRTKRGGRNIMQYTVPHLNQYSIFDEARFAAGELPKWPLYSSMLGNRPAKVRTVLRRAVHKHKLEGV